MTDVDQSIAKIGLARHPAPGDIAAVLEDAASTIRKHGLQSISLAQVLAARGWGTSTIGDGRSGGDGTSSTERAADPSPYSVRWIGADEHYADLLRRLWLLGAAVDARTKEIVRHADDVDPTPPGTGECKACARACRPTKDRPRNRLVKGLCPTCYKAWQRYRDGGGLMLWSEWSSKRREGFSERDAAGTLVAIHTPEPDHDAEEPADSP